MVKRLTYFLFIACVLFLALCAPVFLFAVQDRISNQTVYAENQDLTLSGALTGNYIEDDAERMAAYLTARENGGEFRVVELDSRLNTGEILTLLQTAFHYDELSYGMIDGGVTTQVNTQYAICSADDASDIMFLVTCISLFQNGGNRRAGRLYRFLVDSQTGALYFMSVYYGRTENGIKNKSFDEDLFSDSYGRVYQAAMEEFQNSEIDGLVGYTCADFLLAFVDWYGSDGWSTGSSAYSSYDSYEIYEDLVYYYAEEAILSADLDYSAATRTTLTMEFPCGGQTGNTDQVLEVVTQFGNGDITTGGLTYECRMGMGIADFAVWIPRFGYIADTETDTGDE